MTSAGHRVAGYLSGGHHHRDAASRGASAVAAQVTLAAPSSSVKLVTVSEHAYEHRGLGIAEAHALNLEQRSRDAVLES